MRQAALRSIITLMVEHLDSQLKYTDLFAPSCGSIGDFTDIKKFDEGYVIPTRMQNFLISLCANLMAPFMNRCTPLTRSSSAQKYIRPSAFLHSPSFSTDALATFVHSIPICQKTLATPF